ncbi:MAG: S-layer homology domain-containing protein, partial [Oscillospiraceae bacterium]|nr:S-layer homology domain-containing protein [Oscillospiraceae bacterium]
AVTLYEKVTGTTITGRLKFTDTTDVNVEKAAFIGVVNGMGNNRFDPNGTLTRQQAATMLARLAESVSKPLDKKAATFVDKGSVSTWAIEAVGQCEAAEIMGGTGNNQFSPGGPYQRQQSIATITRLYDHLDGKGTPNHAMEVTTTTPTPTPEPEEPTTTPSAPSTITYPWTGSNPWTGTWESEYQSRFGMIILTQSGNTVTGTYEENNNGIKRSISGTVNGNILQGIKKYDDDYEWRFVLSDDGYEFKIEYLFVAWNGESQWNSQSTAKRIVIPQPNDIVGVWTYSGEPLPFRKENGTWVNVADTTCFGYQFNQDGTFLYMTTFALESPTASFHRDVYYYVFVYGTYSIDNDELLLTNMAFDQVATEYGISKNAETKYGLKPGDGIWGDGIWSGITHTTSEVRRNIKICTSWYDNKWCLTIDYAFYPVQE